MKVICEISGLDMVIEIIDNLLKKMPESSEKSEEWNEGFTAFGNTMKTALMKVQEGDENDSRRSESDNHKEKELY